MSVDIEEQRTVMLERWERAAPGWGKRASRTREVGMPVSAWMIEHLQLQPGHRVLELASGPGDTGFLAAELIRPGGTLLTSDAAEAMLDVARGRARELGIDNVEFKRLELEWLDLPTASVDAILCRWAFMLCVDPPAAVGEARRVLRPGGRIAAAVWDRAEQNPWATVAPRALTELGHASPPDPDAPGMFALADPGRLQELFESAGFVDVKVEGVEVGRPIESFDEYFAETLDLSQMFVEAYGRLSEQEQSEVKERMRSLAEQYEAGDGSITFPGRSLVVAASG